MGRRSGKDMRGRRKKRGRRKGAWTKEKGGGAGKQVEEGRGDCLWPVPYGSSRRVPDCQWMCHRSTDAILATCK